MHTPIMSSSSTLAERGKDDDKGRIFEETDALDTSQIIDELKGKVSDEYFYIVTDENGKEQPGLSYAGTKWIASQMAIGAKAHPLSVLHVDIVDSPDGLTYRAIATVEDTATGERRPGVYEQNKFRRKNVWGANHKKIGEEEVLVEMYRDGKPVGKVPARDPYAYTIAGSKATRNGLRAHMPETIILELFAKWKAERGKKPARKDVTSESKVSDVPPATPSSNAASLEAQLAYDLKPWTEDKDVEITPAQDVVEVKVVKSIATASSSALSKIMETYHAKKTIQGNDVTYTVAR